MNHLGIDVGKRKCRAAIKDGKGKILDEFFFGNDANWIDSLLSRIQVNKTNHHHHHHPSSIGIHRKHVDENS